MCCVSIVSVLVKTRHKICFCDSVSTMLVCHFQLHFVLIWLTLVSFNHNFIFALLEHQSQGSCLSKNLIDHREYNDTEYYTLIFLRSTRGH